MRLCAAVFFPSKTIDSIDSRFSVLLHELVNVLDGDIQNLKGELPHLQFLINSQADNCYCFQLEITVDLTILTAGVQLVNGRKELRELLAAVRAWMKERQELHICEVTLGNLPRMINKSWVF